MPDQLAFELLRILLFPPPISLLQHRYTCHHKELYMGSRDSNSGLLAYTENSPSLRLCLWCCSFSGAFMVLGSTDKMWYWHRTFQLYSGEKVIYILQKLVFFFRFKFGVVPEPAMFGIILSWDVGQLSAAPASQVWGHHGNDKQSAAHLAAQMGCPIGCIIQHKCCRAVSAQLAPMSVQRPVYQLLGFHFTLFLREDLIVRGVVLPLLPTH